jgi:hypothetical protein
MKVKTTLKINDSVMTRLKKEAARCGCTILELVESSLLFPIPEPIDPVV